MTWFFAILTAFCLGIQVKGDSSSVVLVIAIRSLCLVAMAIITVAVWMMETGRL